MYALMRGFSKYVLASLMAGMVAGFQKSGALKELPSEFQAVNPDKVKFVLEHEAELRAMQDEMEKLEPQGLQESRFTIETVPRWLPLAAKAPRTARHHNC